MTDLAEFLLARIAEDEAAARAAHWHQVDYNRAENQAHGFRWDPARVLAECEAKRRIVEQVWPDLERDNDALNYEFGATYADPEDVLRFLALPYASHPDYREEWRP